MAFSPAIIGAVGLGLSAIGTAIGVFGAIQSANATAQSQMYQSQVAERQRQINLMNAQRAADRAKQEQVQTDDQTRALLGEQIAAQSASGLKLGGRSQMLTRKSARQLGRLDALNVIHAGQIEAYNYRVAAEDSAGEARFLRQSASNSALTGWLDAGSTLIGGIRSTNLFRVPSLLGPTKLNRTIG